LQPVLLLAQSPGSSSNSSARKEPQASQGSELVTPPANSNHTNGVYQNLSSLEKSITEKISRLDKLQAKVAENKQKFKRENHDS
jgi:hypothetical protein